MNKVIYFGLLFLYSIKLNHGLEEDLTPLIEMSMVEVVQHYNYSITDFNVTTDDGYILQMLRVQNVTAYNPKLYPIMFFHGLTGCANNWFLLGRQSIVFILADLGYDIWLTNTRGTLYGRRHVFLNPKTVAFWKFSINEIAAYDMPASVDVVLNATRHEKVSIIGHSQGCALIVAMAADRPEYNDKIAVGILMGPAIFFRYPRVHLMKLFSPMHRLLSWFTDVMQLHSVTPTNYAKALPMFCKPGSLLRSICKWGIFTVFEDSEQLQPDMFQYMVSKVPCGGTVRETMHYLQFAETGEFNHFDYGPEKNMQLYNSMQAPPFPLEKVTCKIIIMHGPQDYAASPGDVLLLVSKLSNVVHVESPKNGNWSHMDYLLGKDVYKEAYSRIILFLKRINKDNKKAT